MSSIIEIKQGYQKYKNKEKQHRFFPDFHLHSDIKFKHKLPFQL